jgi:hypothetical protein
VTQTVFAVFALLAGSVSLVGTAFGVFSVWRRFGEGGTSGLTLVATMIGSSLLTISFGIGIGLGIATALEARSRKAP